MTKTASMTKQYDAKTLRSLEVIYRDAIALHAGRMRLSNCKVEFYPYVGLDSRIRVRSEVVFVRISDILQDAPKYVHQALANILVMKLLRRKPTVRDTHTYKTFVNDPQIRQRAEAMRRSRGRKITTSSAGEHYDLSKIFEFLNSLYFRGSVKKPKLSWSVNKTFRSLGHHDAAHETIIISKSLDHRSVPRFVVEFVLFHEMLHIKHPASVVSGRAYYHTQAFRRDEKLFAYFQEAEDWILDNATRFRRAVKKSKRLKLKDILNF